jgi:hypothetical protein
VRRYSLECSNVKPELPTPEDISQLVAFLPCLYADGFTPVDRWLGGTEDENGVLTFPWPDYNQTVLDFIKVAGRPCWSDYEYIPVEAGRMLMDEELVRNASLAQVKTMMTYCVRGERFCTGHWAAMIEQGHARRLLERLTVLQRTGGQPKLLCADNAQ